VVAAQQHAQQQGREGIWREQFRHLRLQVQNTAAAKNEDKFGKGELHQHHPEDEKNA
jgi:hypothetical protein